MLSSPRWFLGVLAALTACSVGPQPQPVPSMETHIDGRALQVLEGTTAGQARVVGSTGAIVGAIGEPLPDVVVVRNLTQGVMVEAPVQPDGSFEAELVGAPSNAFALLAEGQSTSFELTTVVGGGPAFIWSGGVWCPTFAWSQEVVGSEPHALSWQLCDDPGVVEDVQLQQGGSFELSHAALPFDAAMDDPIRATFVGSDDRARDAVLVTLSGQRRIVTWLEPLRP